MQSIAMANLKISMGLGPWPQVAKGSRARWLPLGDFGASEPAWAIGVRNGTNSTTEGPLPHAKRGTTQSPAELHIHQCGEVGSLGLELTFYGRRHHLALRIEAAAGGR